jgi:tRNA U34 5-methylaminomethyl-2-thiouridine-forming methyltransferase MnmC
MSLKLVETEDGSHSLYRHDLRESYHSLKGALQESLYVYIASGLDLFKGKPSIRLFELGFGTGLNAYLAACWAEENQKRLHYHSIENYPLPDTIWQQLNYHVLYGHDYGLWSKLHLAEWEKEVEITPFFHLHKVKSNLEAVELLPETYDLIFYDAFAPSKQPELWTVEALEPVVLAMASGGILVTYCAQGQFKRNLKALGLHLEVLPGPPGKKEMVRAVKP